MSIRSFPVAWRTEGAPAGIGKLELAGTRVVLDGMAGPERTLCEFDVGDVEKIVISADRATSASPRPTLHLDLRGRGWLLINGLAAGVAFEIAGVIAQLSG